MKRSGVSSSVTLLMLAVAALIEASRLPFGALSAPEAGFFPLILAVLLAIFSVVLLAQAMSESREGPGPFLTGLGIWKRMGLATGALIAFAFLFERLGYVISTFLFMAFLLRAVERQKWWLVVGIATATSLVSYLIFGLLLKTPLPAGIIPI